MTNKMVSIFYLVFLMACGGDNNAVSITEVLGIPAGDKEGIAFSGVFSTRIQYTNDGCARFPALEVPPKGITNVVNVTIEHNQGSVAFRDVLQPLFGGVYFDNRFEIGGTSSIDRMGNQNILRVLRLKGDFTDPNTFEATGLGRMVGRVEAQDVDCTFGFKVSGIRT